MRCHEHVRMNIVVRDEEREGGIFTVSSSFELLYADSE